MTLKPYNLILLIFSACAVIPPSESYQYDYFPEGVENTYLGMTKNFFDKNHKEFSPVMIENRDTTRVVIEEKFTDRAYKSIQYHFKNDGKDLLLFQMSFHYPEGSNVEMISQELYKASNSMEGEWVFEGPESQQINIWQTPSTINLLLRGL